MVLVGSHPCSLAPEWPCHSTTQLIRFVALLLGMPMSTADAVVGATKASTATATWPKVFGANPKKARMQNLIPH